ncbi:MAG: Fe-S cluster assembly protein SufD [Pseudomonadales bacterium]|nr:Fe-S cluster assembly protein SufD [Pseudomonadales bacterium]
MMTPNELKQLAQEAVLQQPSLDWLKLPPQARETFAGLEIPSRKTETWKYSPLTPLLQQDYLSRAADVPAVDHQARKLLAELPAGHRLVFVNGRLQSSLSDFADLENQGIVTRFSEASDTQRQLINQHLGNAFPAREHVFAALNYSAVADGVLIHLPQDYQVQQPLQLVFLSSPTEQPGYGQSRVLLQAEAGAGLHLIEQYASLGVSDLFHNHVMEINLQDNARLIHERLQVEQENLIHINGLHINLGAGSHYEQHALAFGSALKRNDINLNFKGGNAYSRLNGVFLSKHRQHIDNHINLEHGVPHCNSDTLYKGFITGHSRAVFNGRIHIHPHAQKTAAHLNNRNLLLSQQAELDTKPELEIYADDVKCSHGASIGKLDESALFYFQSRGIDRAAAEAMLCLGFVNEMVAQFPTESVRTLGRARLMEFFNDVEQLKDLWSLE